MTEELKQLREALRRVKHEAASLADAQVIALEALTQPAQAGEIAAWAQDEQFALAISDGAHIATTVTIYKDRQPRFANTALYTTPPASQEQATDATILRYFAPWLPHPANDDDKQDLIKSARACFAKAPCGCRVGECESKADAHCRMTDEVHHQASQEPSGGEVVKPLFAASVAARKWAELQADGHRMQSIAFDGGKGGPGTITPWGKVMWGATPKPEPMTDEQMADCINKARTSLFDRDGTTSFRIGRAVEAHHGIKRND